MNLIPPYCAVPATPPTDKVLPSWFYHRRTRLTAWAGPIGLLLLVNARHFWLISGEASAIELRYWWLTLATLALALVGGVVYLSRERESADRIPLSVPVLFIGFPCFAIVAGTVTLEWAIPATVDRWILHEGVVAFNLWGCMVAMSLYGFALLASRSTFVGLLGSVGISVLVAAIPVVGLRIFLELLFDPYSRDALGFFALLVAIGTAVAFVAVCIAWAVFNLTFNAIREVFANPRSPESLLLTVVIAAVLPLGGLALNTSIPFPQDFQNPWVYGLTLVNTLILLVPPPRSPAARGFLLFATAATLPFSLYFLCAFIPFLPAAPLAILAVGTGFLILAPVFLSILHCGKLILLSRDWNSSAARNALLTTGCLVLPLFIIGSYYRDRMALHQAMEYAVSPSADSLANPPSSKTVQRAVQRVLSEARGTEYPILSILYRSIVMDGMTLPDATIRRIEATFGISLDGSTDRGTNFWAARERGPQMRTNTTVQPAHATLGEVSFEVDPGDPASLTLHASVHNDGSTERRTEYRGTLILPPQVWISGAELLVNGEWRQSLFSERRAAEWVYRTIASERVRDPLLVTLPEPGKVRIEIFPVDHQSPREFRLHLRTAGPGFPPLQFGNEFLAPGTTARAIRTPTNLFLSDTGDLPVLELPPVHHLVLDHSGSAGPIDEVLRDTLAGLPENAAIRWWEVREGVRSLREPPSLPLEARNNSGGWIPEHAAIQILTEWRKDLLAGVFPTAYPRVSWVRSGNPQPAALALFEQIHPSIGVLAADLRDSLTLPDSQPSGPKTIVLLRRGGRFGAVPAGATNRWVFLGPATGDSIEVYNPDDKSFVPLSSYRDVVPASSPATADLLTTDYLQRLNPASYEAARRKQLEAAAEAAVLVPDLALITLETSAQIRFLQQLEKTGKAGKSGFGFSDVPEPGTVIVGPFLLLLLLRRPDRR